ncbi:beta-ketoacyl synthase chain length factor [Christiangramia forsetii]|uniref:3-oxoacyl-[acyl-carrier-protein] synthase N-terminal domain-like protein n=2 Tax=Christiangramia forsetii TaxID=411153 RepID=A0M1Y7_CHRFK|nr:beta-ketoacyl synthase chain length factor [Christiangramia forsetii]GGG45029.1 3-oxoacyl-ACP synthase [Christiangramia forsetii]CAL66632.1 3-oxoacyl-[acyl-carrier-protein] synthase N-terminal domain-like protein [Christiangramia forsetii KT0803]
MGKIYINGISSISPQYENIFEEGSPQVYNENILKALEVDYKSVIKPMMLRRMSKAVKMGLFCSKKVLLEVGVDIPDAIIVGTGQGCMQDTEKFMTNMLESGEGLLSPTSFIQSTHNTVAGQIALNLKCKAYNMTFTQNSVSFESALIDALLQMEDKNVNNLLIGGVEETSAEFTGFQKLDKQIKDENIRNLDLFKSKTEGTIISESASFFSLGTERSATSYAEFKDVEIFNSIEISKLISKVENFLKRNNTSVSEIDAVILGRNGDARYDHYYDELQDGIFSEKCQIGYKHLVGDNNSVSSYAFWLASKILKENKIPEIFKLNTLNCSNPRNILIYNQYLGRNHGLIYLQGF